MKNDVKKSSRKGWIAILVGVAFGVLFLGFLFLSVQNDTQDVTKYSKTWYGDQGENAPANINHKAPMSSMPMGHDMEHHH